MFSFLSFSFLSFSTMASLSLSLSLSPFLFFFVAFLPAADSSYGRSADPSHESVRMPRGSQDTHRRAGECECYTRRPGLFSGDWGGGTCVCHVACVYEDHIVLFGKNCTDPVEDNPESVLKGVECTDEWAYKTAMDIAFLELRKQKIKISVAPLTWLQRKKRIEWLNGTTLYSVLDSSAENVYHFVSKTMILSWIKSFPQFISRIFLNRKPNFLERFAKRGPKSEHSIILTALLNNFLNLNKRTSISRKKQKNDFLQPDTVLQNLRYPTGNGKILFESSHKFLKSSRKHPLCFESLVFSGSARGALYQEYENAKDYKSIIGISLKSEETYNPREPIVTRKPNLLYIQRKSGSFKRSFSIESENSLLRLFKSLDLPTKTVDLGKIPFENQFESMQWADIIIGIHGANMLNPSLFMREGSILIELFPWNFMWNGYGNNSMALGVVYMGYMLNRQSQPLSRISISGCQFIPPCLNAYRDVKMIRLSNLDLENIFDLLKKAKLLAIDVLKSQNSQKKRELGKTERWQKSRESEKTPESEETSCLIEWKLENKLLERHFENCLEYDSEKKMKWVGYIDLNEHKIRLCVLDISEIEKLEVGPDPFL